MPLLLACETSGIVNPDWRTLGPTGTLAYGA